MVGRHEWWVPESTWPDEHQGLCAVLSGVLAGAIAIAVMAIVGCSVSATATAYAPDVWTDSNGVQYLVVTTNHDDVAVTPRLAPDGSVMVDAQ